MERKVVNIVETDDVDVKNSKIIVGLPDVGLVGVILANHLVQVLGMKEVGYVESDLLPPIMILHKGRPHHPFRLYRKDTLLLFVSEIAIPPIAIYDTAREICEWAKSKVASIILPVGGTPIPNRMEIDKPKVFAIPVGDSVREMVKKLDVELLEEGIIVGPYARIIAECESMKLPCLTFLSQSYPNYPDPGAAAAVAEVLSKILGLEIDVKLLEEQAEEIRLRMKDLMKRTMLEMERMGKSQEYELPAMYS